MFTEQVQARVRRPASFGERGCVVPFKTRELFAARVRSDRRDGLVMLLRDFAGNGSTFVLPWRDVPVVTPITAYDRALHGAIGEAGASTPAAVRAALRHVPEDGGAEAAAEGADAKRIGEIHAALLVCLLRDLGFDLDLLQGAGRGGAAGERLRAVVSRAGAGPAELLRHTERLAQDLVLLGLPQSAGPMRRLHAEIAAFERHLRRRVGAATAEARPYYLSLVRAAGDTLDCAQAALATIDQALAGLARRAPRWAETQSLIRAELDRLGWVQDGWEQVLDRYAAFLGKGDQVFEARELATIAALAPLLPEEELRPR